MTIPDAPKCKTCPYFDRDYGSCRYNPPQLSKVPHIWPDVGDEDWCGKHPEFQEWAERNFG